MQTSTAPSSDKEKEAGEEGPRQVLGDWKMGKCIDYYTVGWCRWKNIC